jgi:DNA-binding MarR family transcriptional regulator
VLDAQVEAVLAAYPALHLAWRRRAVPDGTGRPLSTHLARILDQLDPLEPVPVGTLAHRLRVTPATISIQLNRLARLRLVARERDEGDGRRVLIRLTEAGVRLRSRHSLIDPDRVRAALARLDAGPREAAVVGLHALAEAARALPEHLPTRRTASPRNRRTTE